MVEERSAMVNSPGKAGFRLILSWSVAGGELISDMPVGP